jgi:hypothetical protein
MDALVRGLWCGVGLRNVQQRLAGLSQLKIRENPESNRGLFPIDSQYQIHRPWASGIPLKNYRCASRTGDSLGVQIWKVDDATVGVLLYTGWN